MGFAGALHGLAVRARPGRLSGLRFFHSKAVLYGFVYGRAGRLTVQNGCFRPGQFLASHWSSDAEAFLRYSRAGTVGGATHVKVKARSLPQHGS